jgi:hypothetical protein
MKRAVTFAVAVALLFTVCGLAGERAGNAYKTSKISTSSVLVSCNDEREPLVKKLENTTVILVTCTPVASAVHATWDSGKWSCPSGGDLWADEGAAIAGHNDYAYCVVQ